MAYNSTRGVWRRSSQKAKARLQRALGCEMKPGVGPLCFWAAVRVPRVYKDMCMLSVRWREAPLQPLRMQPSPGADVAVVESSPGEAAVRRVPVQMWRGKPATASHRADPSVPSGSP
jgi:hypothetical protein